MKFEREVVPCDCWIITHGYDNGRPLCVCDWKGARSETVMVAWIEPDTYDWNSTHNRPTDPSTAGARIRIAKAHVDRVQAHVQTDPRFRFIVLSGLPPTVQIQYDVDFPTDYPGKPPERQPVLHNSPRSRYSERILISEEEHDADNKDPRPCGYSYPECLVCARRRRRLRMAQAGEEAKVAMKLANLFKVGQVVCARYYKHYNKPVVGPITEIDKTTGHLTMSFAVFGQKGYKKLHHTDLVTSFEIAPSDSPEARFYADMVGWPKWARAALAAGWVPPTEWRHEK